MGLLMMNKILISADKNNAYKPLCEDLESMKTSLFKGVYENAEKNVEEIIKLSLDPNKSSTGNRNHGFIEFSNIIAFTGCRGSGKTSAMVSFANMLNNGNRLNNGTWYNDNNTKEHIKFDCLPLIDPTHITKQETIIDIVLSSMYTKFDETCAEHTKNPVSNENKRKVYKSFEEVYDAIRSLCQNRSDRHSQFGTLEGLQQAAAGNNLRELIVKLVKNYLVVMAKGDGENSFLVISIDDVDLNISQGFDICEDLRKYLNISNVIVLFSLYYEQMNDVIMQEYLKSFSTLINHEKDTQRNLSLLNNRQYVQINEPIQYMSAKYLEKLIPFNRRCALPRMEVDDLKNKTLSFEQTQNKQQKDDPQLVDYILKTLYKKTGLILLKDKDDSHSFLPNSLRGLVHLISTLDKMGDDISFIEKVSDIDSEVKRYRILNEVEKSQLKLNIDSLIRLILENYIIEFPSGSKQILKLLAYTPWKRLNQKIVQELNIQLQSLVKDSHEEKDDYEYIANLAKIISPENVTIGDLLFTMGCYSKTVHVNDSNPEKFSALFKVLYSLRTVQTFYLDTNDNGIDNQKENLFQLLGGLIRNPDREVKLIKRYDTYYAKLKKESLIQKNNETKELEKNLKDKDIEDKAECRGKLLENKKFLNLISAGIIFLGRGEPDSKVNTNTWLEYRKNLYKAYYDEVSLNSLYVSGNRLQYFAFDYYAFITNILKSDLEIDDDEYKNWRAKYISPIPLFSADFIDYYITNFNRNTKNSDSNNESTSLMVKNVSKKTFEDAMEKICIDIQTKSWLRKSYSDFPLFISSQLLDLFIRNPDNLDDENRSTTDKLKNARKKSLKICLEKLNNGLIKFEGIMDYEGLKKVRDVNRTGKEVLEKESVRIGELNQKIGEIRSMLRNQSQSAANDFIGIFNSAKNEIINLIKDEIKIVEKELEAN